MGHLSTKIARWAGHLIMFSFVWGLPESLPVMGCIRFKWAAFFIFGSLVEC